MIEVGKTYYTRDGRSVRIRHSDSSFDDSSEDVTLATDLDSPPTVVGLIKNRQVVTWTLAEEKKPRARKTKEEQA